MKTPIKLLINLYATTIGIACCVHAYNTPYINNKGAAVIFGVLGIMAAINIIITLVELK